MSDISELKAEIDKINTELASHRVLISALLSYIYDPADRLKIMSLIETHASKTGRHADNDMRSNLGFFVKQLFQQSGKE